MKNSCLKFLLGGTALLSLVGTVLAEDRPVVSTAPPAFSWTGFYIGGHVGAGWKQSESTAITGSADFPAGFTFSTNHLSGPIGGAQIGYNYQVGQWVWGIEGEYSWADIKGHESTTSPVFPNRTSFADLKEPWLATAAARLGYAWDSTLWYIKGGAGWSKFESFSTLAALGVFLSTSSGSETRTGWLVGAGTEWAMTGGPWSARVEVDYVDFGNQQVERVVLTGPNAGFVDINDNRAWEFVAKVGLNYRFGWVAGAAAGTY
jgi:outer membrane immunogenic protein